MHFIPNVSLDVGRSSFFSASGVVIQTEVSSFFEGTLNHFLSSFSLSLLLLALVRGLFPVLFLAAAAAAALTKAIQSSKGKTKTGNVLKIYHNAVTLTKNKYHIPKAIFTYNCL